MLNDEIAPYIDGNGLVSPYLVPPGVQRGSDNGVLHSSRYLILLTLRDQQVLNSIDCCIGQDHQLHRAPDDTSQNAPDDLYGYYSSHLVLGLTPLPLVLPWVCCHPMLLYMRGLAGSFSALWRLFDPVAAAIIYFSNLNSPASETSNRLLTWNIVQGTKRNLLTRLAGRAWLNRQTKLYGSTQAMAAIYYGEDHPLVKYWVD